MIMKELQNLIYDRLLQEILFHHHPMEEDDAMVNNAERHSKSFAIFSVWCASLHFSLHIINRFQRSLDNVMEL